MITLTVRATGTAFVCSHESGEHFSFNSSSVLYSAFAAGIICRRLGAPAGTRVLFHYV